MFLLEEFIKESEERIKTINEITEMVETVNRNILKKNNTPVKKKSKPTKDLKELNKEFIKEEVIKKEVVVVDDKGNEEDYVLVKSTSYDINDFLLRNSDLINEAVDNIIKSRVRSKNDKKEEDPKEEDKEEDYSMEEEDVIEEEIMEEDGEQIPIYDIDYLDKEETIEELNKGDEKQIPIYNVTNDLDKEEEVISQFNNKIIVDPNSAESSLDKEKEVKSQFSNYIIEDPNDIKSVEDNDAYVRGLLCKFSKNFVNSYNEPQICDDKEDDNEFNYGGRLRAVERRNYPAQEYKDPFSNPYQEMLEFGNMSNSDIFMKGVSRFKGNRLSGGDFRLYNYFVMPENFYINKDIQTMNTFDDVLAGMVRLIDKIRIKEDRPSLRFTIYAYTDTNNFRLISTEDNKNTMGSVQITMYNDMIYIFYADEEYRKKADMSWSVEQYIERDMFYYDLIKDLNGFQPIINNVWENWT